jgi:signal transduction histidine kinase
MDDKAPALLRTRADSHPDISDDVLRTLTEDRGRIAHDLNDTLVRQMFAVSLDLHAALARIDQDIDDRHAAEKIRHAIGGLDQAIKDIRNTVFGLGKPDWQRFTIPAPPADRAAPNAPRVSRRGP